MPLLNFLFLTKMINKCLRCDCFFGAAFISAEFTDIYFEVKAELSFYFYAFGDVFRRNGMVLQNRIVNNHFELERSIPKN